MVKKTVFFTIFTNKIDGRKGSQSHREQTWAEQKNSEAIHDVRNLNGG